jgi:hypothetical protein
MGHFATVCVRVDLEHLSARIDPVLYGGERLAIREGRGLLTRLFGVATL